MTELSLEEKFRRETKRRASIDPILLCLASSKAIKPIQNNSHVPQSSIIPFAKMQYTPQPRGRAESDTEFWSRNSLNVQYMLMSSVLASTRGTYHTGWRSFCKFATQHEFNPYLEVAPPAAQRELAKMPTGKSFRELALMSYMTHMYFEEKKKPKTINIYLTGIRFVLKVNQLDISIFSSVVISSYRTSLNLIYRTDNPIADELRLPFTCDMLMDAIRNVYNTPSIEHSMFRTAMTLSFSCLLRASEYLGVHAVRCGDILFTIHMKNGQTTKLSSEKVQALLSRIGRVLNVDITVRYSKTDKFGHGHHYSFKAGAHHADSFDLVQMLFDHACLLIASQPSTPFFKSIGPVKFILTYNAFTAAIRCIARRFGLPELRFKSHSMRIGGACNMLANGVSETIIKLVGKWKSIAFLLYLRMLDAAYNTALAAVSNPRSVTTDSIRHLAQSGARASTTAFDANEAERLNVADGSDDEDEASLQESDLGFS